MKNILSDQFAGWFICIFMTDMIVTRMRRMNDDDEEDDNDDADDDFK